MRGAATGGSERPGKALFGGTEQAMVMGIGMGMEKRCAALRHNGTGWSSGGTTSRRTCTRAGLSQAVVGRLLSTSERGWRCSNSGTTRAVLVGSAWPAFCQFSCFCWPAGRPAPQAGGVGWGVGWGVGVRVEAAVVVVVVVLEVATAAAAACAAAAAAGCC